MGVHTALSDCRKRGRFCQIIASICADGAERLRPTRRVHEQKIFLGVAARQLLKVRLKDLHVKVEGTWLEDCLLTLHDELAERGITVRPHAWISNEWFSPENTPGIAVPFFLAHPPANAVEKKMIIDVEGGTWNSCMEILRHEAGHVVQHAYQLYRRRHWQQLFGPTSRRYPRYYQPNPASRNYVQHLRLWSRKVIPTRILPKHSRCG